MGNMMRVSAVIGLALSALTLAACGASQGPPLWGPDSPRNGANEPVDPIYGTPIPGYPSTTGGGRP